jgi:hypothetical protein
MNREWPLRDERASSAALKRMVGRTSEVFLACGCGACTAAFGLSLAFEAFVCGPGD